MKLEYGGVSTEATNPADIARFKRLGWVEVVETPKAAEPVGVEKIDLSDGVSAKEASVASDTLNAAKKSKKAVKE